MNYINKGKRDILIIPKFSNIHKIQMIREKYDELFNIIDPHITLGTTNNPNEKIELNEEFETIVDSIVVEQIGENEESIIEFEINL